MPCLNESATIGACITKARMALKEMKAQGEIIVADNGSTDGSVRIAESLGAIVVHQPKRGYGNACRAGMDAAKGKFILIADSDGTYDLGEMWKLVEMLRRGYDIVLGSRLRGEMERGSMPLLHRYLGTPFLNVLMRLLFGVKVSDSQSGMRGIRREAYRRLDLKAEGMEFASEMLIKAAVMGMRIGEVPISYMRRGGESKLRTFRDGWRHLRLILGYRLKSLFINSIGDKI
ncbi:glycosyltransferase family 2 protein [Candidatus Poribacteria bacterium]|nr:glycosyltransferase family 2 protein [Candidatus Poribacteria bacterium]